MRIDMPRWLVSIAVLSIAACTPAQDEKDKFVSGDVAVHEVFWSADHDVPYLFTTSGKISHIYYPNFGTEVYFEPADYIDESSIGSPLNKAAAESLKQAGMTPNVPYSIKRGAELSEAREIGLKVRML